MSDRGSAGGEDLPEQDLSVPMWVWTLIGFAVVTAVLIIVIIRGGGAQDATPDETMEVPAETQPVDEGFTNEQPAETQPT